MNSAMLPALVGISLFLLFLFVAMRRPKTCANCGERLSIFQSPFTKTKRMWWEGGAICPKCDCELDVVGRLVPVVVRPRG
jgi:hypothetical protein